MREILFRGKRIDNGEWVEGYYMKHINRTLCPINDSVKEKDVEYIIFHDAFSDWNMPRGIEGTDIDPATLGQYTGLTDKNGQKIFEGDILRVEETRFDITNGLSEIRYKNRYVHFDEGGFCAGNNFLQSYLFWGEFQGRIIGNIHDNPELMEGD